MSQSHKSAFVPTQGIYMLNHSVGRPPKTSCEAYRRDFFDVWENAGEDVWPRWLESVEGFRAALAEMLNGQFECFCPQVNLSSALTKILYSLPVREGRRTIVYTEHDFPSMAFVLQQAQRAGYQLRPIPADVDTLDLTNWSGYLTQDVAFLLLTHVHSNTGAQVPVADISALAREMGIFSIVDIAQSVGCVPINLHDWQVDFVVGSCVKWLCGGPGAGFMWVNPQRVMECEPIDVGWFSHENPFEFDVHDFRYAGDALRFWGGTPSVQPYVTAANSIRLLLDIGITTIREHNLQLTQQIVDAVDGGNLVTPAQPQCRGGTLVLNYAGDQQQVVCARLQQAEVLFDARSTGIRLSPHIYNDAEEIAIVLNCLPA
ncbi:MAG: aminotransferase class V-fold PLP-dependent enzyme [Pseudomonadales bacterium]